MLGALRNAEDSGRLVAGTVQAVMPWYPFDVAALARHLGVSTGRLRDCCRQAVGVGPKGLQPKLRFQGFLALARAGATPSGRRGADACPGSPARNLGRFRLLAWLCGNIAPPTTASGRLVAGDLGQLVVHGGGDALPVAGGE